MSAILSGSKKSQGFSVIEIIIVIAIIVIALTNLLGIAVFSLKISRLVKQTSIADSLSKEAIEAVRNFRDATVWDTDGLGALNTGEDNPYYPELSIGPTPPAWTLTQGTETINNFTRKIIFNRVSRHPSSGDIEPVYNPGNDDPETREVLVIVSWQNKEEKITTYFTNWKR